MLATDNKCVDDNNEMPVTDPRGWQPSFTLKKLSPYSNCQTHYDSVINIVNLPLRLSHQNTETLLSCLDFPAVVSKPTFCVPDDF